MGRRNDQTIGQCRTRNIGFAIGANHPMGNHWRWRKSIVLLDFHCDFICRQHFNGRQIGRIG